MLKPEIIEALEERRVQTHMDHLLVIRRFHSDKYTRYLRYATLIHNKKARRTSALTLIRR